jgi:hypothetical protein
MCRVAVLAARALTSTPPLSATSSDGPSSAAPARSGSHQSTTFLPSKSSVSSRIAGCFSRRNCAQTMPPPPRHHYPTHLSISLTLGGTAPLGRARRLEQVRVGRDRAPVRQAPCGELTSVHAARHAPTRARPSCQIEKIFWKSFALSATLKTARPRAGPAPESRRFEGAPTSG